MRTIVRTTVGFVLGVAVAFLLMVATIMIAATTGSPSAVPLVFSATVGEENGLPSIEFSPNGLGLALVVFGTAAIYVLTGQRRRRDR
ncbi:hypothetical protein [Curtobacterium sp. MCBA15_004]|uniref:hypothetical protein n=1 Tax=Curtobacterium sp. MCBA15_004 TaxID=1898733 RepID=UPI0008DC7A73|nr:hypothetical protein [Curtobacterium sp. MCBA15_004]WIA98008.1 hypothetical protein QOL16_06375 [Curtobacterium sp. MCBA15_004]